MANDGRRKITGRLKVEASFTGLDAVEREKTKERDAFRSRARKKKNKFCFFFLINSSMEKTVEFFVVLEASDKGRERAKSETSESGKEKRREKRGKRREEKRGGN